jgi:hypothetical protein
MLLRSQFSDHMPRLWWLEYFPRGHEADASMYQPLDEVIGIFEPVGWRVADFGTITELSSGHTRSRRSRDHADPGTLLNARRGILLPGALQPPPLALHPAAITCRVDRGTWPNHRGPGAAQGASLRELMERMGTQAPVPR